MGRAAVAGGRVVDCVLIAENFRGLFEKLFEREGWTAGCISKKFKDFGVK